MASSAFDAIEFTGECYRTDGCGADLSVTLSVEQAEGQTNGIHYRCPHCGKVNTIQRRTSVEDPA